MRRPYLARLMLWAAIVIGIAGLVVQWIGRDRDMLAPVKTEEAMAPPPPADAAATDTLAFASRTANNWLQWLSVNWVFVAQVAVVVAVGWGLFAKGLGAYDLIYAESRTVRYVNGVLIGLMFGDILLVQYLSTQETVRGLVRDWPTLFPVWGGHAGETATLRRAGNFLLLTWPAVLLLFYVPGVLYFRDHSPEGEDRAPALGLGLATAPVLVVVAVFGVWLAEGAAEPGGAWWGWVGSTPGGAARVIPPADYPLHVLGLSGLFLPVLGLSLCGALAFVGRVACPVWVIAMLIWLANAVYGLILFHFTGLQYVLVFLAAALAYAANAGHSYKLSLPNMRPEYAAARSGSLDFARLGEVPTAQRPVPLTDADEFLGRFCEQYRKATGTRGKPKLIVAAASGGGIRAAVWTAAVLEDLERRIGPAFARHLRVVTGASGGMVGAGLYAANKIRPVAGKSLAHVLGKDSLWPLMQTFLIRDLPSLFLPFYRDWDRGYSLESTWHRNAKALAPGAKSPWKTTFAELLAAERAGDAPALIFTPLMVEDGRRLIVSNLDLGDLAAEHAPTLGDGPGAVRQRVSVSAVEFFRLFPEAHKRFEVGTAARLNATFPFVSPSVNLPTLPPRRVVDAGYLDNYGVHLLAAWLHRNRDAVRAHCSGVALLEIRAFPMEDEKNGFDGFVADAPAPRRRAPGLRERMTTTMRSLTATAVLRAAPRRPSEKADAGGSLVSVLAGVSTPAEALLSVRSAGAYFRNDQMLGVLDEEFNAPGEPPFLVRVPFECPGEAALSWGMTTWDRDAIIGHTAAIDADDPANLRPAVEGLKRWLNG